MNHDFRVTSELYRLMPPRRRSDIRETLDEARGHRSGIREALDAAAGTGPALAAGVVIAYLTLMKPG